MALGLGLSVFVLLLLSLALLLCHSPFSLPLCSRHHVGSRVGWLFWRAMVLCPWCWRPALHRGRMGLYLGSSLWPRCLFTTHLSWSLLLGSQRVLRVWRAVQLQMLHGMLECHLLSALVLPCGPTSVGCLCYSVVFSDGARSALIVCSRS